ncbi:MAG: HD domain-containing protein [Deltaproteobacteria bacterium]|nr:HD domain-containing protein [Deltaproteobacteria bacterium]
MAVDGVAEKAGSAPIDIGPDTPHPAKRKTRTETLARKFIIAFSAMFVIPLFIAVYLFTEYTTGLPKDSAQITVIVISVLILGMAGFFVTQSVVQTLLRAARDAAAIAEGDITRRLSTDAATEISDLAKNFNRITSRLQHTVDNLQTSKKQMQSLLSQVCASGSNRRDITDMFTVFLNTLLSLTGLEIGAIFLVSRADNRLRVRVSVGLPDEMKSTVIPAGEGIIGWVAANGQLVTTSESMPWRKTEALTEFEKSMPWSVHVPMMAGGKARGVISIGLRKGEKEITGDDLQMIQNLATQVAVAMENADLKEKMERTYVETVAALATAVEARDKYTRGHSKRVTEFSVEIARRMKLPEWFIRDVESAALLHDIGKIGIPDHILHNTGALPPDGVTFVLGHPIGGENILKPVGSLARLCPIVRHHHERYDGKGYPDCLKGEEIPLASRILAVADAFDAMISARAYKPTRTREEAIEELIRCKETQFDPECVTAFLSYLAENPEAGLLAIA